MHSRRHIWLPVRRWAEIVFASMCIVAGSWALFWTFYNPRVPLAEPQLIEREGRGGDITIVLAGDFAPTEPAARRPVIFDVGGTRSGRRA